VSEEEEEESEQIMAKFKDRPGKKSEKKKMQEMVKQRAMEPWINLNFVPNGQYFSRVITLMFIYIYIYCISKYTKSILLYYLYIYIKEIYIYIYYTLS
jgi:hypothetical protein